MTWVRLDGGFPRHPKILAVGPLGAWLYIQALCYVGDARTDGFIPVTILPQLLSSLTQCALVTGSRARGRLRQTMPADQVDWPARLVAAGLWEPAEGGYLIHNYLERNPTKAYLDELSAARRIAGHRGGVASAQAKAKQVANELLDVGLKQTSSTLRYGTKNKSKALSFSGSNHETQPSQSPESASNGQPTAAEAKRKVDELVRRLSDKATPF